MSLLVIEVARQGSNYFPNDFAKAEKLFGDLLEKTGASRILALRSDSSNEMPLGISKLSAEKNIDAECVQIDRLDLSSWTGDEDPNEIWCEHLKNTILNSGISDQDRDNFALLMNSGSNWNSSLAYSLSEVIGGSLWVTEGPDAESMHTAIELSRKLPGEGNSEAVLARMAELELDNQTWFTASEMQGPPGIPKSKGIENSIRSISDLVEHRDSDRGKEYNLTTSGRFHGMLALARNHSLTKVKSGGRGLVLFFRSVNESEHIVRYLKEHGKEIDHYAFIVGGIGTSDEEELSLRVHEKARQHLGEGKVISSPRGVCFSISKSGGIQESSTEVMKILHKIRVENKGIEWSLETANVLGILRPAVYQYSYLAGMPRVFIARRDPTDEVHSSYLSGQMHTLHLPNQLQMKNIRKVIDGGASKFVATAFLFRDRNPTTLMTISKSKDGYRFYDFNIEQFGTGSSFRFSSGKASPANYLKRALIKAQENGAVTLDTSIVKTSSGAKGFQDSFIMTPVGLVSGALLLNNGV